MKHATQALQRVLGVVLLAGCATTSPAPTLGTVNVGSDVDQTAIANDVVDRLSQLYPPAKTAWRIEQSTTDQFGQALIDRLRSQGYGVHESAEKSEKDDQEHVLRYVLDQAGASNLYRMTLTIDNGSLSRPYMTQSGTTVPAGMWLRRE